MTAFLLLLTIWLAGSPLFLLWDAYIGFGPVDKSESRYEYEPIELLVCLGWPLLVPYAIVFALLKRLTEARIARIERQKEKTRFRIEFENESAKELKSLEQEFEELETEVEEELKPKITRKKKVSRINEAHNRRH